MRPLLVAALLAGCGDNRIVGDAQPIADVPSCVRSGTTLVLHPLAAVQSTLTHVTSPPGDDRIFAVQDDGVIRILEQDQLVPTPFLDVSEGLVPPYVGGAGQELGLLGLAFDPEFATNHTFFINYTATNTGDPANPYLDVTMRMQTLANHPDLADPHTADIVLAIPDFAANHNGGMLEFGPDGLLYIGTGDGGLAGDPMGNGQNPHALLGKILRLDVRSRPYAIPADNPFADGVDGAPEVFILGVRNPWRFGFDPPTGDLWIADVGQDRIEELDVLHHDQQRGANLGWSMYEGSECFHPPCDPTGLVFPKDERRHSDGWCAIIGGAMYRGSCFPDLDGEFFYSDNCRGGLSRARLVDDALEIVDPAAGDLPYVPTVLHADWRGDVYVGDLFGNLSRVEAQ